MSLNELPPELTMDLTQPLDTDSWDQTGSGKIFSQLTEIGKREGKNVTVTGKNTGKEVFSLGDEHAVLYKNLEGGSAGERNGILVPSIESHDYKRLLWWKEAVAPVLPSLQLLDASIVDVGTDAGIDNITDLDASMIAQKYGLSTDGKSDASFKAELAIAEVVSPVVTPNFTIRNIFGKLRMVALTPEGVASRYEDNAVYSDAMDKVRQIAPRLPEHYSNLSK